MTWLNELEHILQELFTYPENSGLGRYLDILFLTVWPMTAIVLNHYDPSILTTIVLVIYLYTIQILQYLRGAERNGGVVRDTL